MEYIYHFMMISLMVPLRGIPGPSFYNWHAYTSWSDQLFKQFVSNFVKIKIQNAGFPPGVITDQQKEDYVKEVSKKENISLNVDEVRTNSALRNLGKLIVI